MTIRVLALAAVVGGVVGISAPTGAQQQDTVYRPGPGITNPAIILQPQPKYTTAAQKAGIQGDVELEAVVQANGTVGEIRVVKSLDSQFGLDQEAIKAAKQWLFKPGMKDGVAVPIRVTLVISFNTDRAKPASERVTSDEMRREIAAVSGQTPPDDFAVGAYAPDTPGLTRPKSIRQLEPKYTRDAMQAKIQGDVTMEAIIAADGTVARARVKTSLDKLHGLDEEALKAVRQWTFEPATLGGLKVPVLVSLVVTFRLH